MPQPGFRYAYGPDGDRIQVPDNRDSGPPIKPPSIDRLVPPKKDERIRIDDRPLDPRLDRERGKPIGEPIGGIEYGPVAPPPGVPDRMPIPLIPGSGSGVPAIKDPNEAPLKFRPIQKPIRPKPIPISIGGVGGGTYKEFPTPGGGTIS